MAGLRDPREGIGHGKLLLFGEHVAVYGHPAVGIPLHLSTRVELLPASEPGWSMPDLSPGDARSIRRLIETMASSVSGALVRVHSDVPRGSGLGSSAALCVALASALHGGHPPPLREVWQRAHRAEALFHGTPSGVDTGLSVLPGMRSFHPDPPFLPTEERLPDLELSLVLGHTPRSRTTGELVAGLRRRLEAGGPRARAALEALGRVAREAEGLIRSRGGPAAIGALATEAHDILVRLGLSAPATDELLARGVELGALGGKLSGAGGGGAFFLVVRDPESAVCIAADLRARLASMGWGGPAAVQAVAWSAGVAGRLDASASAG